MMLRVPMEPGEVVTLEGVALPGIFRALTVGRGAVLDDRKRPNRSGSSKRPKGFEDAEIRLSMAFVGDAPYAELKACNDRFLDLDRKGQPKVVTFLHPHVQARGIKQVIFTQLDTTEQATSSVLTAALEFVEWRPMPKVRRIEAARLLQRLGVEAQIELTKLGWAVEDGIESLEDRFKYDKEFRAKLTDLQKQGARSGKFFTDAAADWPSVQAQTTKSPPADSLSRAWDEAGPSSQPAPTAPPPAPSPFEDEDPPPPTQYELL